MQPVLRDPSDRKASRVQQVRLDRSEIQDLWDPRVFRGSPAIRVLPVLPVPKVCMGPQDPPVMWVQRVLQDLRESRD